MHFISACFILLSNISRSLETSIRSCLHDVGQRVLMGTNVWKRINFNVRRDYMKKTLQEIADKNLESSRVSRAKYLIFRSDLNRSYCRILYYTAK